MVTSAFVSLWDKRVGAIFWDPNTGVASFEYSSFFKNYGWDIAPVKMPIHAKNKIFSFPELHQRVNNPFDTFKGLPGLLADALPDKYGNQLINTWLARHGREPNSLNPVEQLCFIGTRGMGALEFEPATPTSASQSYAIEIDSLVEIARSILSKKEKFDTQVSSKDSKSIVEVLKIGTSAGGARPKAIIAYNPKTGQVKSGQSFAPAGFEHWLIKLDGVSDEQFGSSNGYGRIEMAYYQMAIDCGIEMMESQLFQENGRAHFMTKRFDRSSRNIKHHIQTFCAIEHFDFNNVESYSYEQLFQTMRKLNLSYPEMAQQFKRMVFNVVARNCDDHTKNFAFRMPDFGEWELAPAYDICHAYRPDSPWVSQHSLSINGKRENICKSDLELLGENLGIKKATSIINEVTETVSKWNTYAEEFNVNASLRDAINSTLIKL
jgi:serine/threonine-protein kinase HipA